MGRAAVSHPAVRLFSSLAGRRRWTKERHRNRAANSGGHQAVHGPRLPKPSRRPLRAIVPLIQWRVFQPARLITIQFVMAAG